MGAHLAVCAPRLAGPSGRTAVAAADVRGGEVFASARAPERDGLRDRAGAGTAADF